MKTFFLEEEEEEEEVEEEWEEETRAADEGRVALFSMMVCCLSSLLCVLMRSFSVHGKWINKQTTHSPFSQTSYHTSTRTKQTHARFIRCI